MLHTSPRFYAKLRLAARRYLSANAPKSECKIQEFESPVDVVTFRKVCVSSQGKAVVFRRQTDPDDVPSIHGDCIPRSNGKPPVFFPGSKKWFIPNHKRSSADLSPYLSERLNDHMVPFELVLRSSDDVLDSLNTTDRESSVRSLAKFMQWLTDSGDPLYQSLRVLLELQTSVDPHRPRLAGDGELGTTRFIRFDAPFALFVAALAYNKAHLARECFADLYITQFPLSDLPKELQDDFPMPEFLAAADPAPVDNAVPDVYSSSLWLGLEPTYTPWHCDPNHNLFCQLTGSKVIRLMPPEAGLMLFQKVKRGLGGPGSPFIRGEEMMQGPERKAFFDAVWSAAPPEGMLEVELRPRDVLYLNKHWWHSVRSVGDSGRLNASVNWWFQWRNLSPSRGWGMESEGRGTR